MARRSPASSEAPSDAPGPDSGPPQGQNLPVILARSVEMWPIGKVSAFEGNARTHSPVQIRQIASSMQQWGWTMPVLVDEGGVLIAGHARVAAGRLLGVPEVPVIVARGWSEAQRRAYVLADNQLALNAGWDGGILSGELAWLKQANFKLTLIGFSGADLRQYLNGGGQTDPESAPPAPVEPVSRPGDLYLLGEHRLVVGDCTEPSVVARLLEGVPAPHLMVTDPPYGVNYDPAWRARAGLNSLATAAIGKVSNDSRADWRDAWALFPGSVCYVWHGGLHAGPVQESLVAAGFRVRAQIVWVKQRPVIGRGHYHWQHEPALYAGKDGEPDHWQDHRFEEAHETAAYAARDGEASGWQGSRRQRTVWPIEHAKSDTGHGTQKPVECMRRPMLNSSAEGDAVYDPFVGSGTSIIAAEMTARRCFAVELDPVYADVAVKRWELFTGRVADRQ